MWLTARGKSSQHGVARHTLLQSKPNSFVISPAMESKAHKSRHHDRDNEHRNRPHKRKKRESEREESRKNKGKRRKEEPSNGLSVVDDDVDDDDLWVEKSVDNVAAGMVSS